MKPLRVLSIGAGAIGTYIGGSLALQGHTVAFVERPQVVGDLKSRGLRLTLADGEHRIPDPRVFPSMEAALDWMNFDISLFALKSYDTAGFIKAISLQSKALPAFLCLSNGLENEQALADAFGAEKVIAGTVTTAVGRRGAGDIICERLRGVGIAADHPLSARLVANFNQAGLNARLFSAPMDMKWSKMLTNLIANASSAILDMPPAEIFARPDLYRLEIEQLREALAVMRAQNISVVDLPGTPVRLLAFAVHYLPLAISRPFLRKAIGSGRGAKMPSFHIDLHCGRDKSEVDYLNGAIVRAGQRTGIATPVNQVLTETLLKLTDRALPLDTFSKNPDRLLSLLP